MQAIESRIAAPQRRRQVMGKRGRQRSMLSQVQSAIIATAKQSSSGPIRSKNQGTKRRQQSDTESISQHQQQPPRATRQKTTHAAPPRQQERTRAAPQPQPQSRAEPTSNKQTSSPESPAASSAPTTSLPPTPPTRDELLLGFFHHNATEEGLSYTLCVLPAGDDRTRGEWELYEDFDPTKRSHTSTRPAPSTTTRRRTTWSGRWSLRPERDGFGWVELLKTAEAVQENGRTVEQQCLMSQCCPYNVTTENSAADGSRRKVMGIMLNAFDRSGGLFLTRAL